MDIGLDIRALGANPTSSQIDQFSLTEADRFRRLSPENAGLTIGYSPGWGGIVVLFEGPNKVTTLTWCTRAVAHYLEVAPRLPITMDPAANVVVSCHRCD